MISHGNLKSIGIPPPYGAKLSQQILSLPESHAKEKANVFQQKYRLFQNNKQKKQQLKFEAERKVQPVDIFQLHPNKT